MSISLKHHKKIRSTFNCKNLTSYSYSIKKIRNREKSIPKLIERKQNCNYFQNQHKTKMLGVELSGPSISVNDVTLRYSKHGPPVLDNVNIREESEFIDHSNRILPCNYVIVWIFVLLNIKTFCLNYINWWALNSSLTVQRKSIYCLLGPSGCGKTSLLKVNVIELGCWTLSWEVEANVLELVKKLLYFR